MAHPHLIGAILFAIAAIALIFWVVHSIHTGSIFARWHVDSAHHRKAYSIALAALAMLAGGCVIVALAMMRAGSLAYLPPVS